MMGGICAHADRRRPSRLGEDRLGESQLELEELSLVVGKERDDVRITGLVQYQGVVFCGLPMKPVYKRLEFGFFRLEYPMIGELRLIHSSGFR
jgi:hypothetical protein